MNVAKTYIPLVNVAPLVERVRLPPSNNGQRRFRRRIKSIVEIADYEDYRTLCEWNPVEDNFRIDLSDSVHLKKIALRHGLTFVDVLDERLKTPRIPQRTNVERRTQKCGLPSKLRTTTLIDAIRRAEKMTEMKRTKKEIRFLLLASVTKTSGGWVLR